MALRSSSKIKN